MKNILNVSLIALLLFSRMASSVEGDGSVPKKPIRPTGQHKKIVPLWNKWGKLYSAPEIPGDATYRYLRTVFGNFGPAEALIYAPLPINASTSLAGFIALGAVLSPLIDVANVFSFPYRYFSRKASNCEAESYNIELDREKEEYLKNYILWIKTAKGYAEETQADRSFSLALDKTNKLAEEYRIAMKESTEALQGKYSEDELRQKQQKCQQLQQAQQQMEQQILQLTSAGKELKTKIDQSEGDERLLLQVSYDKIQNTLNGITR